ncbi:hypothetical protein ADK60_30965 [Streptomyces sp. XY431]|uniref:hypothetical protein n=1 Tax=Streptomyces sp. XY431 TaxID=1415562 RepID=UPI0006ADC533|nr:hypothetical protein [Streptomyces sp. XY431]KOV13060.1 hypothetical protein ADK60_30965 [Streptomyces sp. XY431]
MDDDLGGYQSLGAAFDARIAPDPARAVPTVSRGAAGEDNGSLGFTEPVRLTPSREPDPRVRRLAAGDLT